MLDHIRKTHTYLARCRTEQEEPREEFVNAICCLFSYGQLASKPVFAANLCVEYLTLALLFIGEMAQQAESRSQVKYGDYFAQLKARILEEVMPFSQNDTSPELRAYYQGQGDAAFFSRLRDFLSQRVSQHASSCQTELSQVQSESVRIRGAAQQRKMELMRQQIQVSSEVQHRLQQEFQEIFAKAKSVIF